MSRRAEAVIEALRGLQIGDTIEIVGSYMFSGSFGKIVEFNPYSDSGVLVQLVSGGPLWFSRSELRLV